MNFVATPKTINSILQQNFTQFIQLNRNFTAGAEAVLSSFGSSIVGSIPGAQLQ